MTGLIETPRVTASLELFVAGLIETPRVTLSLVLFMAGLAETTSYNATGVLIGLKHHELQCRGCCLWLV